MEASKVLDKRILVAGDAMLDAYHFGKVERISPEAPVPVFLETGNEKYVPGGAANVAVNIAAIGIPVSICAVIGNDGQGKQFLDLMDKNEVDTGLIKVSESRRTITKLRYIGPGNQQILRVDDENTDEVKYSEAEDLLKSIEKSIGRYGVIVLSDYKKGFLTNEITAHLIEIANKNSIPVLVDVKDVNFKKYANSTLIKPNRKELKLLSGMEVETREEITKAISYLCKETPCKYVLATLGSDGMVLGDENGLIDNIESVASEVFDVTGAGDTSIAYLAAEILLGRNVSEAMRISNYAAGVQVSRVGTSVVFPYEVYEAMQKAGMDVSGTNKANDVRAGINEIIQRKKNGEKIVFTNGCFDILHKGHITYLKEAKRLGDILVIGLNTDESVRRLKGDSRPVNSLEDRELMLSALSFVDYVIPFEEDTPKNLIDSIVPDILVKGGDYRPEDIVGADTVLKNGGEVRVLPFISGHSTSEIIRKIQEG